MKKVVAIALALAALVASYAVADDDAVYSVNTIGVVKYTIPPQGKMTCISVPLNTPPDVVSDTWGNTSIAAQLQPGSTVFFWNETNQTWSSTFTKGEDGTWAARAANRVMRPGEAFFVKSPSTATEDHIVSYVGELNLDDTAEIALSGANNLNAIGCSRYPVGGKFGDTFLATNVTPGSSIYFWNNGNQTWGSVFTRSADGTWAARASNYVVNVGSGVFVKDAGEGHILEESRPFDFAE